MIDLHYSDKVFSIPEAYNELTGEQLLSVKQVFTRKLPMVELRLELLRVLFGMEEKEFFALSPDLLTRILYCNIPATEELPDEVPATSIVDFLLTEEGLTAQLLPVINGLYGPKSEFDNLKMKEFHVAELRYMDYIREKNLDALDELVAVLYRPCKPGYDLMLDTDGDARMPFNPNELPYYRTIVAQWPHAVKIAVLQWYDNCRAYLEDLYNEAFTGGESNAGTEPDGMFGLMRSLAGERWGTFQAVEELNVHTVFKEIEATLRDNQLMQTV
jgi:hypothetical protein